MWFIYTWIITIFLYWVLIGFCMKLSPFEYEENKNDKKQILTILAVGLIPLFNVIIGLITLINAIIYSTDISAESIVNFIFKPFIKK